MATHHGSQHPDSDKPGAIYDVEDPVAFVSAQVAKSGLLLSDDDRNDLIGEGLLILCELAESFKPRLDGYEQDGWFSGYAARYLPRRLSDAWHRMNPEHQYVRTPDGKREWRYLEAPVSLDGIATERQHHNAGNDGAATALDRALHNSRTVGQFTHPPRERKAA